MTDDLYKILDVPKDATEAEIKRAYREKAAKAHPDRRGGDAAKMAEVNTAYRILSDHSSRRRYDEGGTELPKESLTQLAVKCIMQILGQIIDVVPEHHDVMEELAKQIGGNLNIHTQKRHEWQTKLRKAEVHRKRIKRSAGRTAKGRNFIDDLIADKIRMAKLKIGECDYQLKILERAMELAAEFEYLSEEAV